MNHLVKITSLLAVFVSCAAIGFAQEKAETKSLTSTTSAVASGADTRIPRNSKVYIAPMEGFENYLAAALRKKDVPLIVVADREAADFEIVGDLLLIIQPIESISVNDMIRKGRLTSLLPY